jgi:hypothetical protein
MWRLTKAIFISWLIGVVCGVGMVIWLQREDRTVAQPPSSASNQITPTSADGITR